MFNLEEVAAYLHLKKDEVETLIQENNIPFEKRGDRIFFRKKDVDVWASHRILNLPEEHLTDYHKKSSAKAHDLSQQHAIMPELMKQSFIDPALTSKTKPSVIRDMVKLAESSGMVPNSKDLLVSLEERERLGTTALAGGIALLHPRNHEPYMFQDSFIALGRAVQPVGFGAPDGSTSDLFFLVCCQEDGIHLHTLARICMMCYYTTLVLDLRDAPDAASIYDCIIRSEQEVIGQL